MSKAPYGRKRPYGRLLAPQAPIVNGRLSGGAPNLCINRALPRINKHKFSYKFLHRCSKRAGARQRLDLPMTCMWDLFDDVDNTTTWHIDDVDSVHGERIGSSGEQLLKNDR